MKEKLEAMDHLVAVKKVRDKQDKKQRKSAFQLDVSSGVHLTHAGSLAILAVRKEFNEVHHLPAKELHEKIETLPGIEIKSYMKTPHVWKSIKEIEELLTKYYQNKITLAEKVYKETLEIEHLPSVSIPQTPTSMDQ